MSSDDLNTIEKIKQKLYSKRKKPSVFKRRGLRKRSKQVSGEWKVGEDLFDKKGDKTEEEKQETEEEKTKFKEGQIKVMPSVKTKQPKNKKHSKVNYLLIFSILFFLISLGIGYFFLVDAPHFISSKKVNINISGPASVEGGEKISFEVSVENNNNAKLKIADLVLEFPQGTRSPQGDKRMEKKRIMLGDIAAGETVERKIVAVFFGKRGTKKEINTSVEYRLEGSNAIFSAEQIYPITVSSSPLEVSVESMDEIVSGKDISFKIKINSNSDSIVEDVLLRADYPFGWNFIDANFSPLFGDKLWKIGDIPPGGEKTLLINGELQGQESEMRIFKFDVGTQSAQNDKKIEAVLAGSETEVKIKRPFLGIELAFNGDKTSNFITESGENVKVDLIWQNNTSSKIFNVKLFANLKGNAFNGSSISTRSGFYNSSERKVVWDKNNTEELAELNPGESGKVTFDMNLKEIDGSEKFVNPEVPITVNVEAQRSEEGRVPEKVSTVVEGVIRMSSVLDLTSRVVYSVGPFDNSGPIPPKAESETEYTVLWTLVNSSNDTENVEVSTSLPSCVEWTGNNQVSTGKIKFKSVGGEVVWEVGEMPSDSRAEAAFQIKLNPSVTQVGSAPNILRSQIINGFDTFTENQLRHQKDSKTTEINTDPQYNRGDGKVIDK